MSSRILKQICAMKPFGLRTHLCDNFKCYAPYLYPCERISETDQVRLCLHLNAAIEQHVASCEIEWKPKLYNLMCT